MEFRQFIQIRCLSIAYAYLLACLHGSLFFCFITCNSFEGIRATKPASPSKLISIWSWLKNFHETDFCWLALPSPFPSLARCVFFTPLQPITALLPGDFHGFRVRIDVRNYNFIAFKNVIFPNYVCTQKNFDTLFPSKRIFKAKWHTRYKFAEKFLNLLVLVLYMQCAHNFVIYSLYYSEFVNSNKNSKLPTNCEPQPYKSNVNMKYSGYRMLMVVLSKVISLCRINDRLAYDVQL